MKWHLMLEWINFDKQLCKLGEQFIACVGSPSVLSFILNVK
jgi:hypothetical protein